MNRHRILVVAAVGLWAAVGTYACGDGATEPPPPTPDPPRPATIGVAPATVQLTALGATEQLTAEVRDQNGNVMAGAEVSWSTSAAAVATVTNSGLVTAAGNGTATITATAGSASGSATVTVAQEVSAVAVTPAADTVVAGDTLRLSAEATDANGNAVAGADFAWTSNDTLVAIVDGSGLVTGKAEGTATITAVAGEARGTSEITVENPDRAALVALYNATVGPNWVNNENWLSDAPLGDWYGVDTNRAGRVWRLDLSGSQDLHAPGQPIKVHGLAGSIPSELGALGGLRILDLGYNDLSGPIPAELGRLANLTLLRLRRNSLTGPIPRELGDATNLKSLDLAFNELSGPIPSELGNLASLEELFLAFNSLSGPIPAELGNATPLELLDLAYNDLSGSIPAELGDLASLWRLALYENELTGPIPPELGDVTSLTQLWLRDNDLSGVLPSELGDLARLTSLNLRDNALSGPVPQSLLQLGELRDFHIAGRGSLCMPGTRRFLAWLQGIERHDAASSTCNAADVAALHSLFETVGGTNWTESTGWLTDRAVEEWHGVSADSLGHVTELDLTRNGLAGRLPVTLGDLVKMSVLRIGDNALSGRLPLSLAGLPLRDFNYEETDLCAPADASFQAWLNGIPSHDGTGVECAPLSDREILEILYDVTGGPNWTNNENWLTDAPLRDWYGVRADGDRVVGLSINRNNLTGPIPPELGKLDRLQSLGFNLNNLSGSIPPALGNLLNLNTLRLWTNDLSGSIPPEFGNLANLKTLSIGTNNLTGPIPPELGNLANLEQLFIGDGNAFNAPIPPELGRLTNLERLSIRNAQVTGTIPPELGNLASLTHVWLFGNELSGPIPPELGNLGSLEYLILLDNNLTGAIPRELGDLGNLVGLFLAENALTGSIPPELGNLSTLEELDLASNDLSGSMPPGVSRMASLRNLSLTNNAGLEGPLPGEMTSMRQLEALLAGGTDLCVPSDPVVQAWLQRVHKRRIAACVERDPPAAYLTQAAQSRDYPVPLVAGERALLRVFPTANQASSEGIPAVRARFFAGGRETHVVDIPGKSAPIPTEVDESSLHKSANAEIPGNIVQPGLEMAIEIDPEGTLDEGLGVAKRIPESGRLAMDVRAMPTLDLTLIPFVWTETHDLSIVDLIEAMAADPENHEMLGATRTLLPVDDLDVTAHEPVLSSSNSAFRLLDQTKAIRAMEGGMGHYKGMMSPPVTDAGGIAELPGRSSFSSPRGATLAHELGHNMNLQHAPCGTSGDSSYPYRDGSIGTWGYDFDDGSLVPPSRPDLMSYCFQEQWIGDYGFTNALRYRLFDEGSPAAASVAASGRSLLLWGGIGADTVPYLEPAFVVEAPPTLPDSAGDYRVIGHSADGGELFSLSFAMFVTADGDGSSSFVFILPVRPGWQDSLASITLAGPGGSVTLDGESEQPMAILRNPRTGQVRGFLRDLPPPTQAAMDTAGQAAGLGLEVLFSRAIPDAAAWRR